LHDDGGKLKKTIIVSIMLLMLTNYVVNAACDPTYNGGTRSLTIGPGSVCTSTLKIYILSGLFVSGYLRMNHDLIFHKSVSVAGDGGINDVWAVNQSSVFITGNNAIINSVVTSSSDKCLTTTQVGCINAACMQCVCSPLGAGDPYCCGDSLAGGTMGFWDSTCSGIDRSFCSTECNYP
jgi:hypothetical protein